MKHFFILFHIIGILFSCSNTNDRLLDDTSKERPKSHVDFDTSQLVKTSKILDEDTYWSLVGRSVKSSSNQEEQEQFLIVDIEKLSPQQMIGFRLRTDKLLADTYNSEMWCAGYIMNGGCSDDGFEHFRCWIISRGKDTYYKAKANPDYLIHEIVKNVDHYEFESFWYVALDAFKLKTGADLYNYVDYKTFNKKEGGYKDFKFTWQEENPESMKKICPELFAAFDK